MTAVATAVKKKQKCGFCLNNNHEKCVQVIENGKAHGLWTCGCEEATCGGRILLCIKCKRKHDDVTPDTRQCVDMDACAARIQARREADPTYHFITQIIEESKMAQAAEKAEKREKVTKVKEADCSCGCGGKTKGGKFLPGHDARFVSEQVGHVLGKNKTEAAARKEVSSISEALGAKFDKSLTLQRAKVEKAAKAEADRKAAAKAKADEKAKAKAEKASAKS